MPRNFCFALLICTLSASASVAQNANKPDQRGGEDASGGEPERRAGSSRQMEAKQGQMGQMSEMEMWKSVNNMAEQCEAMMRSEMAWRPLKITAAALVGVVAVAALVLSIILQVQAIRWLGLRIKHERDTMPRPSP